MKKILLVAILTAGISHLAQSQTLMSEYLYITEGLGEDLAKGRSIEPSYRMEKLLNEVKVTEGNGNWKTVAIYYYKSGTKNKAFILECKGNDGRVTYLCIPTFNADSEIWDKVFIKLRDTGASWYLPYTWALARLSSFKGL